MRRSLSTLWVVFLLIQCSNELEPFEADLGQDYYPVELGSYRTYEVSQINYEISGFDTLKYFLRESVEDTFSSNNEVNYLIFRETRSSDTLEWEVDSVRSVRIADEGVVLSSGNVASFVLSFPIAEGKTWNINAFNARESMEVSYAEVVESELSLEDSLIAGMDFIKVLIADIPENIVNQNQQYEVYARGVGLVEKKATILEYCTVDCDSAGQILNGIEFTQRLIDYGLE